MCGRAGARCSAAGWQLRARRRCSGVSWQAAPHAPALETARCTRHTSTHPPESESDESEVSEEPPTVCTAESYAFSHQRSPQAQLPLPPTCTYIEGGGRVRGCVDERGGRGMHAAASQQPSVPGQHARQGEQHAYRRQRRRRRRQRGGRRAQGTKLTPTVSSFFFTWMASLMPVPSLPSPWPVSQPMVRSMRSPKPPAQVGLATPWPATCPGGSFMAAAGGCRAPGGCDALLERCRLRTGRAEGCWRAGSARSRSHATGEAAYGTAPPANKRATGPQAIGLPPCMRPRALQDVRRRHASRGNCKRPLAPITLWAFVPGLVHCLTARQATSESPDPKVALAACRPQCCAPWPARRSPGARPCRPAAPLWLQPAPRPYCSGCASGEAPSRPPATPAMPSGCVEAGWERRLSGVAARWRRRRRRRPSAAGSRHPSTRLLPSADPLPLKQKLVHNVGPRSLEFQRQPEEEVKQVGAAGGSSAAAGGSPARSAQAGPCPLKGCCRRCSPSGHA